MAFLRASFCWSPADFAASMSDTSRTRAVTPSIKSLQVQYEKACVGGLSVVRFREADAVPWKLHLFAPSVVSRLTHPFISDILFVGPERATFFLMVAAPGPRQPTEELSMRIRSKEIRNNRKREAEQLKARIKELQAAKAAPVAAPKPRTRRTTTAAS